MQVVELLQEETHNEYIARLVKTLNIKKMGQGFYSHVFQHPVYHNVAVKIIRDDPMYLRFAKFCLDNPLNPWLPKIVSIHKVKVDDAKYDSRKSSGVDRTFTEPIHIVFFQKLRSAKAREIQNWVYKVIKDLPTADEYEYRNFDDFHRSDWADIAKYSNDDALRKVAQFFVRINARDIHNGNVMIRDDGAYPQLVFTDPVAS